LELQRALLSLKKRNAGYFIARVFNIRDYKWVERCSSIIKEKTEVRRVQHIAADGHLSMPTVWLSG
jgi:hypothetical protein